MAARLPDLPKPRTGWRQRFTRLARIISLFSISIVLGFGIGFLFDRLFAGERRDMGLWNLLWLLPLIFLVVLAHEAGHLAGGKLGGGRFLLLIVGPLKVMRATRGCSIGWNPNPALFGGLAACLPPEDGNYRRFSLRMVLGGPLASLALGLLLLAVAFALSRLSQSASLLAFLSACLSLMIFIITLIPGRAAGYMTDGAQLLALLTNPELVRQRMLLRTLQAQSLRGVRPAHQDPALLEHVDDHFPDPQARLAARLMAYYFHLDRGEAGAARLDLEWLGGQLDHSPAGLRAAILLEMAFFEAFSGGDPARARRWLSQGRGALVEGQTRLRAEAAVLLAEGRRAEAYQAAERGLQLTARSLDPGGAQAESDWLRKIAGRAQEEQGSGL